MTDYVLSINAVDIDAALTNSRTPTAHAASHKLGATDALKLTDLAVADNVDTLNATSSYPGLLPTLSGVATEVLTGTGEWSAAASSGSIDYPGSSTVFLNGNGAWATPSASGSAFRPYITVGTTGSEADYVCDGTSDNYEIQAAMNAAPSGSEIVFLAGTYNLTSGVYQTGKNLSLRGVGKVIINYTVTGNYVFNFEGASVRTTSLTGTATKDAYVVPVTSNSGLAAGQQILVSNDVDWTAYYAGHKTGELYKIKSVSGYNVTLTEPLIRTYTVADTAIATIYEPVRIQFENINIVANVATTSTKGIAITNGTDCTIKNCTIRRCGVGGIYLYTCYDTKIIGCTIENAEVSGTGYGIGVTTATTKCFISNNNINACRHCISVASVLTPGQCRDIIVDSNNMFGSHTGEPAFDAHVVALNVTVSNNVFQSTSGIACQSGALDTICIGNYVTTGDGFATRNYISSGDSTYIVIGNIVKNGYIFEDNSGLAQTSYRDLVISNNVGEGGSNSGIYINSGATTHHSRTKITGNQICNTGHSGIYLGYTTQTGICRVDVSGNTIDNVPRMGIYMGMNIAYQNICNISNNTIIDPNTAEGYYSGILLEGVVGANIGINTVTSTGTDTTGYGIRLSTGCNTNMISGNLVHGMNTDYGTTGTIFPATIGDHNYTI